MTLAQLTALLRMVPAGREEYMLPSEFIEVHCSGQSVPPWPGTRQETRGKSWTRDEVVRKNKQVSFATAHRIHQAG